MKVLNDGKNQFTPMFEFSVNGLFRWTVFVLFNILFMAGLQFLIFSKGRNRAMMMITHARSKSRSRSQHRLKPKEHHASARSSSRSLSRSQQRLKLREHSSPHNERGGFRCHTCGRQCQSRIGLYSHERCCYG